MTDSAGFGSALVRALRAGWRLVTLRRTAPEDFAATAELFAVLIVLDMVLMFLLAVAAIGLKGEVNLYEFPRALMFVPMVLAAGLVARRLVPGTELLLLPVAFAAASVWMTIITALLYVVAQHGYMPWVETYWMIVDDAVLVWAALVVTNAALRLLPAAVMRRLATALAAIAIVVLPNLWFAQGLMWMPRYDESTPQPGGFYSLAEEAAFYAQSGALERELEAVQPERPGVADLYVIAAALYAGEDVFMKEVKMITALLGERFDAAGRTVTLINNPKTLDEHPIASLTSLRESLKHVGETMNKADDVLVLYITSHGSEKHELAVDFRPLRFATIDPSKLKAALDDSGIRWKVIIVSACYSGGFVDPLKDARTLIITAASADRTSFGCGSASDATYLAKALFGEALKKTYSFEEAFGIARAKIEQWEREQGETSSQPQLHVGEEIRRKLAQVEKRLAARPASGR